MKEPRSREAVAASVELSSQQHSGCGWRCKTCCPKKAKNASCYAMPQARRPAGHPSLSQAPSELLGGLPPRPGTAPASLWRRPRTGYPWLAPPRTPEGQGQRHAWKSSARVLDGKQVALLHHVAGKMLSLYCPNIGHQDVAGILCPSCHRSKQQCATRQCQAFLGMTSRF